MVGNEERAMTEAARPNLANMTQAIMKPDITGHFDLKQYMVELIQYTGQYVGLSHKDLQRHIQNFLKITDTYNYPNVFKDYVRNLERQMGELASNQNTRPADALPSDTEENPQVNVTFKNGRELEGVTKKRKDKPIHEGELITKATHESKKDDASSKPVEAARPPSPFPQRLQKKNDDHMFQNKLPQKLKDPGSFTILVRIGNIDVGRALCNLGVSINLMPLSLFKQLDLGAPRPTTMMLQLTDRSIGYPKGVIEDVLLQIGKFIFPADFIILDYEADELVPIILGQPLLAIGDAIIKVKEEK
uniref:Uncharacterized protein LOC104233092 n=1 Tax=Nicotiana sylvestris TaxID=4096 RepID=A0A1U7XCN1_NICSY|nr:PREDICTED: uncharacterized protein LOC104233092 [Nicotiana sylvestris]